MLNDDAPVGRLLSRREVVATLGATGAAWLAGGLILPGRPAPRPRVTSCVVRPEQTEGPYFVDTKLDRSDIRAEPGTGAVKAGAPLALTLLLSRMGQGTCEPLPGALVDVWQCDAAGVYSGVRDPNFDTTGQAFLRGHQRTNARGEARFVTIYPGWYPGRTVHIHFKVRTDPDAARGLEFTSQIYFDDAFTDRVFAAAPYAGRGPRNTRNRDDEIFQQGGDQLMLAPEPAADGYAASFAVGLDVS